jgi:dCMP deaminase
MKEKFKQYYMRIAAETGQLSYARRLQVGAIVVKDDRIISIGYNGMPSGWENNCEYMLEDGTIKSKPEVLHAETNAIAKLAKSTESGDNATMFITHGPCLDCAKLIYQAGIDSVCYREDYRSSDGIDFLRKSGVSVEQINTEDDS